MTDTHIKPNGQPVLPHHQRAIDRLVALFQDDPRYRALIIGGSIAKGWERPDSDVDIVLICTDEEFARRQAEKDHCYLAFDLCDYEGGYVDGKIVSLPWLEDLAQRGNEPSRSAFVGAWPAFSHIPDLEALLARVATYPEAERERKMQSFFGQVQTMQWFIGEATRHNNRYLLTRMASELVLFGGRLILAHNRILYPYHKWLMAALAEAPDKPADLLARIDALLADPSPATAEAFVTCLTEFQDWPQPPNGWGNQFMQDVEWGWQRDCVALADW